MEGQIRVRTVLMRGGSSKAVFLNESHIPADEASRTKLLLALFGSPDKRQIDGLGGSDYLTSKCAIMGPPSRPDADVDYTFVQVSVENPVVSYDINCGNISAAAGVYAIEEGYVRSTEPETLVRVHNTNTGKIMKMKVPVAGGTPKVDGDFAIDGVPGTGAEIKMDYSQTAGAATGRLLPTGNAVDKIRVETLGKTVDVSIVDIANLCVFIRAPDLGLKGTEMPGEVPAQTLKALEEIRVKSTEKAGIKSYLLPFQVFVGPAQDFNEFLTGRFVPAKDVDFVARLFVEGIMHKAYAGTGATCLATAAKIQGTVVSEYYRPRNSDEPVRIGHPSGMLPIRADVERNVDGWKVNEVLFSRTARRLFEGYAYVRNARLA
jgi:2-methylaconitate cis-trans-isomerase PrpF